MHKEISNCYSPAQLFLLILLMLPQGTALRAQSPDDPTLQGFTEHFRTAYRDKNLKQVLAFWGVGANGYYRSLIEQQLSQQFAQTDAPLSELILCEPPIAQAAEAWVRFRVVPELPTSMRHERRSDWVLYLRKEAATGSWKIHRAAWNGEELVLLAFATELPAQRERLLALGKTWDAVGFSNGLRLVGSALLIKGQYAQAELTQKMGLQVAEEHLDQNGIAKSLSELGVVAQYQGDFSAARAYYGRSLQLAQRIRELIAHAAALVNLGNLDYLTGDFGQAQLRYQQALAVTEQAPKDNSEPASILREIASAAVLGQIELQVAQGNLPRVAELLKQLPAESGNPVYDVQIKNSLGMYALHKQQPQAALQHFQSALAVAEKYKVIQERLRTLQNIATAQALLGNEAEAQQQFQKNIAEARAAGESELEGQFLLQLGLKQLQQQQGQVALTTLSQAEPLLGRSALPELTWQLQTALGQALAKQGQAAAAQARFQQAIDLIEGIRQNLTGTVLTEQNFFQSQLLQNRLTPYYELLALQIKQRDFNGALQTAQQAQGRVLLEVLQSNGGQRSLAQALTPTERVKLQKLDHELYTANQAYQTAQAQQPRQAAVNAQAKAQLQALRNSHEALQNDLMVAHPELRWRRGNLPVLAPADWAALLPNADTAVLNFLTTPEQTFLFVLTKDKTTEISANVQVFELPLHGAALRTQVELFRQRIANRDFAYEELARQLYQHLLAPASAALQGKRSLILIPDGVLWNLPFQALQPVRARFLLQDFSLTYAPSLPVLQAIRARKIQRETSAQPLRTMLAFGDPRPAQSTNKQGQHRALMSGKLAALPAAARQVNGLRQIYGAQQTQLYLGTAAQEARFKREAGQYRFLHLATHGEFNDQHPLYSHLVLAAPVTLPTNSTPPPASVTEGAPALGFAEDGLLEAWELLNLNLQADLVVLSACETGRGRIGLGEGALGLAWAFFAAGATTSVVSQWKVEAESTADLMLAFHRKLQPPVSGKRAESPPPPAQALRQAALQILQQSRFQHPFYWAGFIVMGESR